MEIDTAKPNNPTPPSENVAGCTATQKDRYILSSHLTIPNEHICLSFPVNSASFSASQTNSPISEKKLYLNRPRGPKINYN